MSDLKKREDRFDHAATIKLDLESVPCALCGSEDSKLWMFARDFRYQTNAHFSIVECLHCGLRFTNPRIKNACIFKLYPADYYAHSRSPGHFNALEKKTLIKHLLRVHYGYGNARLCDALIRCLTYPLRSHGSILSRMLPRLEGKKLLDVGCGAGNYLSIMRKLGAHTYGVEPNQGACLEARKDGHDVYCGELFDSPYADRTFDAVTMWHVFEHMSDPMRSLNAARRLLKMGGMLALIIPNSGSVYPFFLRDRWLGVELVHYYYYTSITLRAMLREAGFTVIRLVKTSHGAGLPTAFDTWSSQREFDSESAALAGCRFVTSLVDRFAIGSNLIVWAQ